MPWVEFLRESFLKDRHLNTPDETRFLAGQVVELDDRTAQRWLRRNACKLVDVPTAAVFPAAAEAGVSLPPASPSSLEEEDEEQGQETTEDASGPKRRGRKRGT